VLKGGGGGVARAPFYRGELLTYRAKTPQLVCTRFDPSAEHFARFLKGITTDLVTIPKLILGDVQSIYGSSLGPRLRFPLAMRHGDRDGMQWMVADGWRH
jgi:hypothetical protein